LVECEQVLLGMRGHRCHDIGVVNLTSSDFDFAAQRY